MGVWLLSICYTHKYWCNLLFKSHLLFVITRMLAKTCVDWNVQITAEVWVLHFCLLYASMRLFAVVSILLIVSTTSISGRIQYECSFVVGGSVYQEKDGRWVFTREELTSNIAFGHYERDMNTTGIFPILSAVIFRMELSPNWDESHVFEWTAGLCRRFPRGNHHGGRYLHSECESVRGRYRTLRTGRSWTLQCVVWSVDSEYSRWKRCMGEEGVCEGWSALLESPPSAGFANRWYLWWIYVCEQALPQARKHCNSHLTP